ncbi:MAG: HD domain-containing protein [Armatimonadetes bacterium]|nr:HD domain-containing protein [Armatimonadota bacterium]
MIALSISLGFCLLCVLFAIFHLPTVRRSRMDQIGRAIASAVECRSPFLEGMFDEIGDLSEQLSLQMGLDRQTARNAKVAALLCDIGLCSVPSAILQKTEEWTPEEQALFDRHTEIGASIVRQSAILRKYSTVVQHHHTKFEVEPRTPITSRIIGVAADYVRYKRVYGDSRALTVIDRQSGIQYDPKVVNSLKELVSLQ